MKRILICAVLWLTISVHAEEFDAKVIAVMDGDTVLVLHNDRKIKIRLSNIDAPEIDQEFGRESRQALIDRVLKKRVHVNSIAMDNYGRMVAELSMDGQSVNEELVSSGFAWEYSHFHGNKRYVALNKQAQQSHLGLWALPEQAVAPQQWRKAHPKKQNVSSITTSPHTNSACGSKHLCSQMISCDEAKIYFLQCGVKSLDGNSDGIPCESLCLNEKNKPD